MCRDTALGSEKEERKEAGREGWRKRGGWRQNENQPFIWTIAVNSALMRQWLRDLQSHILGKANKLRLIITCFVVQHNNQFWTTWTSLGVDVSHLNVSANPWSYMSLYIEYSHISLLFHYNLCYYQKYMFFTYSFYVDFVATMPFSGLAPEDNGLVNWVVC